jgi:hypothetical protein
VGTFTAAKTSGDELTASHLATRYAELTSLFVRKSADETVNNTATLQADDQLVLPVAASVTYRFMLRLIVNTNATADFKMQFTFPSGTTMSYDAFTGSNPDTAASSLQGPSTQATISAFSGVAADQTLHIVGMIITSTTAGSMGLTWAQNTANVSDTIVKTNSYWEIWQVL